MTDYVAPTLVDGLVYASATFQEALDAIERLDAEAGGDWTAYTPVWTSTATAPDIGNGTLEGWYRFDGLDAEVKIRQVWGSTTTNGTGFWGWNPPAGLAVHANDYLLAVGVGYLLDAGSADRPACVRCNTTANFGLISPSSDVTPGVPWAWGNGDELRFWIRFRRA